jgi:beta-lactamase class A
MTPLISRRGALSLFGASIATACTPPAESPSREGGVMNALAEIERSVGGRVGVFAMDTSTGRTVARREDERFAMCSTFKWALAAAVLSRVDRGELSLGDAVPYGRGDLQEYAPVTLEHVEEGSMTVEALAQAAVLVSDNTAANLLLARVGGPGGLTQFVRQQGDTVTRLDRDEPGLNENLDGDERDTTSPKAMVGLMRAVLVGQALSPASRDRLLGWMRECKTGLRRLRAGLPEGWVAGDKTGTGANGSHNDVMIAAPAGRAPILVASFMSGSHTPGLTLETAHANIARLVVSSLF